ncbi:dihydroxyacetone kinase [Fomitiporia mediterranea MF3/22]|uniref:dihydroxyacetone kinase n=1 Tax=Fomitiporia mediterranea (strain MF3/22) TaxID=694068 RepID=UPI0004407B6D|nr:dihydroxyacetone kinase [Fomitiporia mediterranea MF3/22]EJD07701.1 dihydroxyacetone kinase [Fomitiporia mediterranea MF3/22]
MNGSDKHLLNSPATLVVDSLKGLCATNPKVRLDTANKVVYQAERDDSKVALICGGGSGHEPSHAGFVGEGMLTAAVCGNIFASPNANQVRRAIELVDNKRGTLIIVKNYTGDVLNFGLAKENYAASHPEKIDNVKFVNVGDDVAVGRSQGKIVGRRGLAGTVIVYKIAGALAHRGASIEEVYKMATWLAPRLGTVGVGLEHCHVPGTEAAKSHLSATEVEIGMGIHNEPGHTRLSPVPPLNKLIVQLLDLIMSTSDNERSFLPFRNDGSDEVVLMVNNLGGLSELEMSGIANEAVQVLGGRAKIERVLVGSFMTSLNMPGFSLTLLLLPTASDSNAPPKADILSLLDERPDVPGWRWSSQQPPSPVQQSEATKSYPRISAADSQGFVNAISKACKALIAAEPEITQMDNIAGDGDCGLTLKAGAEGVLKEIDNGTITGSDTIGAILTIAKQAEEQMGGTSGALYSIFFSSLAQGLVSAAATTSQVSSVTPNVWSSALDYALNRLYSYTRARPPSRTLVDPLAAFVQTFSTSNDFSKAVKEAADAAEATKDLEAKAGRSAYVGSEFLKKEKVADPGAWGVKTILESI